MSEIIIQITMDDLQAFSNKELSLTHLKLLTPGIRAAVYALIKKIINDNPCYKEASDIINSSKIDENGKFINEVKE